VRNLLARSGNGHFLTTNVVDFVFGLILLYFARTCVAFSVRKLLGKMRKYLGRINMTEKRKHEIDFFNGRVYFEMDKVHK
jgi:uncharacterized membrane protein